jgi:cystathionine gamma-synthase
VLASTYHAGGVVGYGRYGNPTWSAFEAAVGALDGGTAVAFSCGNAATSAVISLIRPGGVVVAPTRGYHGSLALLREAFDTGRLGELRRVDAADTVAVVAALPGADLIWIETPANPTLELVDVATVVPAARAAGVTVVIDGTFLTPVLLRGLDVGADIVVHSGTKFLSGHSDALIGVAVAAADDHATRLLVHRSLHGSVPGTTESWLALRGLRTLALRVEQAQANARVLAGRLATHPGVERVRYPGLGAMLSVDVAGGAAAAERLCYSVRLWVHATSLGGVESMLERRRRWATESTEVPESLVRMSVGIEDVDDLWRDLEQALASQ